MCVEGNVIELQQLSSSGDVDPVLPTPSNLELCEAVGHNSVGHQVSICDCPALFPLTF